MVDVQPTENLSMEQMMDTNKCYSIGFQELLSKIAKQLAGLLTFTKIMSRCGQASWHHVNKWCKSTYVYKPIYVSTLLDCPNKWCKPIAGWFPYNDRALGYLGIAGDFPQPDAVDGPWKPTCWGTPCARLPLITGTVQHRLNYNHVEKSGCYQNNQICRFYSFLPVKHGEIFFPAFGSSDKWTSIDSDLCTSTTYSYCHLD